MTVSSQRVESPERNELLVRDRRLPRTRLLTRGLLALTLISAAAGLMYFGIRPGDVTESAAGLGIVAPLAFIPFGAAMMSLLVPKTAVSLSAGVLFGVVIGSVTLSVTAVLAALVNFCIGRWWLGHWVASRDGERWRMARGIADDAGFVTHLLFRLSPVPTSAISYSMGAAGARLGPFLLAAGAGSIPQWMWVWCGAAAASAIQTGNDDGSTLARWVGVAIAAIAAIGLAGMLPHLASKHIRKVRSLHIDDHPSIAPTHPQA